MGKPFVSALPRRMLVRMFEQQQPKGLLVALGSNVDRLPCAEADRYPALVDATSALRPASLSAFSECAST